MTRHKRRRWAVGLWLGCGMMFSPAMTAQAGEIHGVARLLPSGDGIEIEYEADGDRWKYVLPIHRTDGVRYFSTGIGMAERQVVYPSFPLKIVLTARGKPFLAHVDVHLVQQDGRTTVSIPADQVTGPWIYLDLPPGVYEITGNRGEDKPRLRGVAVKTGSVSTVYLRFAEDAGP